MNFCRTLLVVLNFEHHFSLMNELFFESERNAFSFTNLLHNFSYVSSLEGIHSANQ